MPNPLITPSTEWHTSSKEPSANSIFAKYSPFWHLWTPENHEVIFSDEDTFHAGMTIFAIAAACSQNVRIVTFELMTNHIHVTLSGSEDAVRSFFRLFREFLDRYLKRQGKCIDLQSFDCKLRKLTTIDDLRNVIAYNNRNGFLVNSMETPFSYPWGANAFYFNRHAVERFRESSSVITKRERTLYVGSRQARKLDIEMTMLDGHVCPLSFCDIGLWEHLFLNAHQYLSRITRNIEAQKEIADEIGDQVFYTDNELFSVVSRISNEKYGVRQPSQLASSAKIDIATIMKSGYHATNKQIQRVLGLDAKIIDNLFPRLANY